MSVCGSDGSPVDSSGLVSIEIIDRTDVHDDSVYDSGACSPVHEGG